ncbi:unnamed protein product [Haemonchus placei]|uniref:Transposase n=1 Tax=Haemonchus placei TaxID=6290 RepID=A0A0N4WNT4_HAEPC|nr:unnamed protein product [Haemonchus placei]
MVRPSPDGSAIVRLHKTGRPPATIAMDMDLGIHRSVVYHTLQRYRDLGGLQDYRRSGRPRTARTPEVVEAVRKRRARNATRSISTMARNMGISQKSMERIIHEDLKMYPHRTRKAAILSASNQQARVKKCRQLLLRTHSIVFSDEKLFTVEQLFNAQNSNACATPHPNLDSLKAALIREWDEIDDVPLRPVIDAFLKRLRAVVRAKGGRIEK